MGIGSGTQSVATKSQWDLWRGLGAEPLRIRSQTAEVWGSGVKALSRRRQKDLGTKFPALGDFCTFSIKTTHFEAYFGQNSYFKAFIHQLKAFEKSKRTK